MESGLGVRVWFFQLKGGATRRRFCCCLLAGFGCVVDHGLVHAIEVDGGGAPDDGFDCAAVDGAGGEVVGGECGAHIGFPLLLSSVASPLRQMGTHIREEISYRLQSGPGWRATVNKRSGVGDIARRIFPVACWNGRRCSSVAVKNESGVHVVLPTFRSGVY